IPLLENRSETTVQDTEHLLRRIGPAAGKALAKAAVRAPEMTRVRAVSALGDFTPTDETHAALLQALKDKSEYVRANAAESIGVLRLPSGLELTMALSDS